MDGQKRLFQLIKSKIGNYRLADMIGEVLGISDDAVYRRIRGETLLTLKELKLLCDAFNFSLDSVLDIASPYRGSPFMLYYNNYFELSDIDFRMSEDYCKAIKVASGHAYSEFGHALIGIPLHTRVRYPSLFKLFMLKWMYLHGDPEKTPPYSEIVIPDQLLKLHQQFSRNIQFIKYTYIIYHESFLFRIVQDIQYFHAINLLTDENVEEIKNSLIKSLDNTEKLLLLGTFDTGNKIDIYTSGLDIEGNYTYLLSENIAVAMLDSYTLSAFSSVDIEATEQMRKWMHSLRRTSTMITGSEKNRIQFMNTQRKIINSI